MTLWLCMSSVTHSRSVLRSCLVASAAPAPATTTSADFSLRHSRRPFRHEARSPQVRTHSFTAQPPDLRRLTLDHESFAVSGPLALVGTAFYPVRVPRLAASLHASSPHSVALMQLRFASFAVINSREDLHLQECAHAGRTKKTPGMPGVFTGERGWGQALCQMTFLPEFSQRS